MVPHDRDQMARRFSAEDLPVFRLAMTSNETFCPSLRLDIPARSTALMCTNTSWLPSSGWMNPKPFWLLNHFTVPCVITTCLSGGAPHKVPPGGNRKGGTPMRQTPSANQRPYSIGRQGFRFGSAPVGSTPGIVVCAFGGSSKPNSFRFSRSSIPSDMCTPSKYRNKCRNGPGRHLPSLQSLENDRNGLSKHRRGIAGRPLGRRSSIV
jgi:hypothetical protein